MEALSHFLAKNKATRNMFYKGQLIRDNSVNFRKTKGQTLVSFKILRDTISIRRVQVFFFLGAGLKNKTHVEFLYSSGDNYSLELELF